jgi:hypothetical protein
VGKLSLPGPLLRLRGPSHLTTDVVGFKAGGHPCAPLYPYAPSVALSLPPSPHLKKERGKEKGESKEKRKQEEIPGSQRCFLPFLLEPWRSKIGLLPPLCQDTYKSS